MHCCCRPWPCTPTPRQPLPLLPHSARPRVQFTAGAASVVYINLGAMVPDYAYALLGLAFSTTLAGQLALILVLRVLRRRSIIILMMATLLVTATVVAYTQVGRPCMQCLLPLPSFWLCGCLMPLPCAGASQAPLARMHGTSPCTASKTCLCPPPPNWLF